MSTRTHESGAVRPSIPRTPPLQQGDHLSAEEFERRFDAMPDQKKAELIDGVVYMGSPVSIDDHGAPNIDMATWLGVYKAHTPGLQAGDNATVRLDPKNRPQPDLLLRILPEYGGQSKTTDGYVDGAPEWAGEIAASSASYDLYEKLVAYWRNGVKEYVVWRVWDAAIDWFVRGAHEFERLPADSGLYKSRVFPGLWLDASALLAGNMVQVLTVLQQGLASPEHAAFCATLKS
jgi:Uma2 family endonuclease